MNHAHRACALLALASAGAVVQRPIAAPRGVHTTHRLRPPLAPATASRVTLSAAAAAVPPSRPARGIELIGSSKLNAFSLLFGLNAFLWGALLIFPMWCASLIDARRVLVSRIGNIWGRLVLRFSFVDASIVNAQLLPPPSEAVMYVANHCSYLDVPLTGLLRRPLKVRAATPLPYIFGLQAHAASARPHRGARARARYP